VKRVMLLARAAVAVTMMTVPAWAQTDPPSPSAATRPDSSTLANVPPHLRAIREAPDPSAAIDAYAKAQAVAPGDPATQPAFVERMVELGLPEMAEMQARDLARQDPKNGLSWGVLAYSASKRGHIGEALADLTSAYRLAPDEPFVQSTAGQLLAWYDSNATRVAIPAPTLTAVTQMQKELQDKPAYANAYRLVAQVYQQAQALGPDGPGSGYPGGYPWGNPGTNPGAALNSGAGTAPGAATNPAAAANPGAGTPGAPSAMIPPDTLGLSAPNYAYYYYYPAPQFYGTYQPQAVYVTPPYYDSYYWWPTYSYPVIVGPFFAADFADFGGFHRFHRGRDFHDGHEFHARFAPSPTTRMTAPGAAPSFDRGPTALAPQFTVPAPGQHNPAGFFAVVGQPPPQAPHFSGPVFDHRTWSWSQHESDVNSNTASGGGGHSGGGHSGGGHSGGGGGRHR
jgi:uncharacterized membrane protein YgcG